MGIYNIQSVASQENFEPASTHEFMEMLKVFCDLNRFEMKEVGHWLETNWAIYTTKQREDIKAKISDLQLTINRSAAINYFLSSFFQNAVEVVADMHRKKFIYQLFPYIDYFTNRNSDHHHLALIHAFLFIMDNFDNHTTEYQAKAVLYNFKCYMYWIQTPYNPVSGLSRVEILSITRFINGESPLPNVRYDLYYLHTAIQNIFMNNHPVIHALFPQITEFLRWWFQIQTTYKFDYSDHDHTPWKYLNDFEEATLKSMVIYHSRHVIAASPTHPPSSSTTKPPTTVQVDNNSFGRILDGIDLLSP